MIFLNSYSLLHYDCKFTFHCPSVYIGALVT